VTVTLVEAETRLGGKILTEHVDGFVIEGGPDSFLASKPRGVGLCRELGLEATLHGPTPRRHRAFVWRSNLLHELPEGLTGLVPTRLQPVLRSRLIRGPGKVRFAADYLLPARKDPSDEALAAFMRRRLGREVYDWLVEPLMAGIYAGDGDELSLAATFPQLRQAERNHGGLIRGITAQKERAAQVSGGGPTRSPYLTPRDGLSAVITTIVTRLKAAGVELRLGVPVIRVERAHRGTAHPFRLHLAGDEVIPADGVVLATPAYETAEMVASIDQPLAATLEEIPYASSAIVTLAYPRETVSHPLDGHGYLVPRAAKRPILACTWTSRKWSDRAPAESVLLRVFLGRHGQDAVLAQPDDRLVALAQAEIRQVLGIDSAPSLSRLHRWPRGMPQYTLGHLDRLATIEQRLVLYPGLQLAGHAYRGVGLPDCIAGGERAALAVHRAVLVSLRETRSRPAAQPKRSDRAYTGGSSVVGEARPQ